MLPPHPDHRDFPTFLRAASPAPCADGRAYSAFPAFLRSDARTSRTNISRRETRSHDRLLSSRSTRTNGRRVRTVLLTFYPSWRRSAVADATRARTVVFRRQLRRPVTKDRRERPIAVARGRALAPRDAPAAAAARLPLNSLPRRYHPAWCSSRNTSYFGRDSPRGISCTRIRRRDDLGRAPRRVSAENSPAFRFSCQCWSAILRQLSRSLTTRGEWRVCACRGHRRVRSAGWAECVVSASGRHLQSAPQRQRSTPSYSVAIIVTHVRLARRTASPSVFAADRRPTPSTSRRPVVFAGGACEGSRGGRASAEGASDETRTSGWSARARRRRRRPFRLGIRDALINALFPRHRRPTGRSFVECDMGSRFVNRFGARSCAVGPSGVDSRKLCGIAAPLRRTCDRHGGGRAMKMAGRCCVARGTDGRRWGGGERRRRIDRRNRRQRSTAFPAAYPRFISVDVAQYARLVG